MKITHKLLLVLFFLCCNYAAVFAQITTEMKGIKGEVKEVSATIHKGELVDGKVKVSEALKSEQYIFNEASFLTFVEYTTNASGTKEASKQKKIYEFDKDNHIVKETTYRNDVEGRFTLYTYKDGKVAEAKHYRGSENFLGTQQITYDANGNKLTNEALDPAGKSMRKAELSYNKDNKVTSSKDSKGEEVKRHSKYEYPSKNKEKITKLDPEAAEETMVSYMVKTYDDDKNLLNSIDYTLDGTVKLKYVYEYNKEGQRTLRQAFDADEAEEEYLYMRWEYKYDAKGNWTQRTEFTKDGSAGKVTIREIKYYN
jgi:hypothetical protein